MLHLWITLSTELCRYAINAYQKFVFNGKLPWGDNLELEVNGTYNDRKSKTYDDYRLDYNNQDLPKDYRNIYRNSPARAYRWEARGEYYINALNNWTWRIYTLFNQQNIKQPNNDYRLDKLKEWANGMHALGKLPSTADSLMMARSWEDSQYNNLMTRNSQSGLHFYYNKQTDSTYTWIRIHLPFYVRTERLTYQHAALDTRATRTKVFMDGNINTSFVWKKWRRVLNFNFRHNTILPDINNLVAYDNSNPLSITLANSNLKTGHKWSGDARYQHRFADNRTSFSVGAEYWYQTDPVVNGYAYNRQTGAYTFQMQNADYAWEARLTNSFSRTFDKQQHWTLSFYHHIIWSGNQVMELPEGQEESRLFGLRTLNYWLRGSLDYRNGDLSTGLEGSFEYINNHYQQNIREGYHSIDAYCTHYISYNIPVVNINLSNSFSWNHMKSSLSYAATQNYYIWNLAISRSFLKSKKLTAMITAYDLLNSVTNSSYRYSANSFSVNNIDRIGRYFMLSLSYKININPKKNH